MFLVGFDQCGFTAWRRKSSNNNAPTRYSALATTDVRGIVHRFGSPTLRCGYEIETRAWFCARAQHLYILYVA